MIAPTIANAARRQASTPTRPKTTGTTYAPCGRVRVIKVVPTPKTASESMPPSHRTRQEIRDHAKRREHSFEEESLLRHDVLHLHERKQRSDKDKRNNERADAWRQEPGRQIEQPTRSDRETGLKDNEPEHRMLQVRNMECRQDRRECLSREYVTGRLSQPEFARRVNVGDGILCKYNGLCENPHDDCSGRNSQNDRLSTGLAPAGLRRFKCNFSFHSRTSTKRQPWLSHRRQ